jgi:hypothetical protein
MGKAIEISVKFQSLFFLAQRLMAGAVSFAMQTGPPKQFVHLL